MATVFASMWLGGFIWAVSMTISGCTQDRSDLIGRYEIVGEAQDATLELTSPDRYRFCEGQKCSTGIFKLGMDFGNGTGRVTFNSPELEAYVFALHERLYGLDENRRQRGRLGYIDLSYSLHITGARIHADGGSDTAFVKR